MKQNYGSCFSSISPSRRAKTTEHVAHVPYPCVVGFLILIGRVAFACKRAELLVMVMFGERTKTFIRQVLERVSSLDASHESERDPFLQCVAPEASSVKARSVWLVN